MKLCVVKEQIYRLLEHESKLVAFKRNRSLDNCDGKTDFHNGSLLAIANIMESLDSLFKELKD